MKVLHAMYILYMLSMLALKCNVFYHSSGRHDTLALRDGYSFYISH